jgi:hypothetical protein
MWADHTGIFCPSQTEKALTPEKTSMPAFLTFRIPYSKSFLIKNVSIKKSW